MKKIIYIVIGLIIIAVLATLVTRDGRDRNEPRATESEEVTLSVGQTKEAAGIDVTLNNVLEDYRCAVGETCPEAGGVAVNTTFDTEVGKATGNMTSDSAPVVFAGYAISITRIEPQRATSTDIQEKDYKITFKVDPNGGSVTAPLINTPTSTPATSTATTTVRY